VIVSVVLLAAPLVILSASSHRLSYANASTFPDTPPYNKDMFWDASHISADVYRVQPYSYYSHSWDTVYSQ
jgi:hypothetical protein